MKNTKMHQNACFVGSNWQYRRRPFAVHVARRKCFARNLRLPYYRAIFLDSNRSPDASRKLGYQP
jgi:hypothetical protein